MHSQFSSVTWTLSLDLFFFIIFSLFFFKKFLQFYLILSFFFLIHFFRAILIVPLFNSYSYGALGGSTVENLKIEGAGRGIEIVNVRWRPRRQWWMLNFFFTFHYFQFAVSRKMMKRVFLIFHFLKSILSILTCDFSFTSMFLLLMALSQEVLVSLYISWFASIWQVKLCLLKLNNGYCFPIFFFLREKWILTNVVSLYIVLKNSSVDCSD